MIKNLFFSILFMSVIISCQREQEVTPKSINSAKINRTARVRAACNNSTYVTDFLQHPKAQNIYTAHSNQWFMLGAEMPITWNPSVVNGSEVMIVVDNGSQVIFWEYVQNTGTYNVMIPDHSTTEDHHITISSPSSCVFENAYFHVYRD
jgi:hypothetical protein